MRWSGRTKAGKPSRGGSKKDKLSLFDAVGMAIGGMVGGGIFAALGEAVQLSGNAAFLSFVIAGVLALITGLSYSKLTTSLDESGGSYLFLKKTAGRNLSGTVSWFLILGYALTIALYSFVFGIFSANLFGLDPALSGFLGAAVVIVLAGINLMGVRESGITEDVLVYGKIAILLFVAVLGMFIVSADNVIPIFEHPPMDVITAAALIFVAYEGFQLLTYDYDDIEDKRRNLPRAMWIAILTVTFIYALVAFVTTGVVSDQIIRDSGEFVLAYTAQPLLGHAGFVLVLVAGMFSTASAIHATIFATARLANKVSEDGQLPQAVTRRRMGGVPLYFIVIISAMAIAFQVVGNLTQIISFSSLVFLSVFAFVNFAAYKHHEYKGWRSVLPIVGVVGCVAAMIMLSYYLLSKDISSLIAIGAISVTVIVLRLAYTGLNRNKK